MVKFLVLKLSRKQLYLVLSCFIFVSRPQLWNRTLSLVKIDKNMYWKGCFQLRIIFKARHENSSFLYAIKTSFIDLKSVEHFCSTDILKYISTYNEFLASFSTEYYNHKQTKEKRSAHTFPGLP